MKASELRIGNKLFYRMKDRMDERQEWNEVDTIDAEDILSIQKGSKSYLPIPLTEEWLKKFGFKDVIGRHGYKIKTTNAKVIWNEVVLEFWNEWHFSGDEGIKMSIAIKHVHQLQNLYFALTGEELTTE